MQYIRRLASQVSRAESTNDQRSLNDNGTTSSIMDQRANNTGTATAADSWNFSDLDKDNRVDKDGEIVVTRSKRDGVFQELMDSEGTKRTHEQQPPSKRIKLESDRDTGQTQDSAIDIPPRRESTGDVKLSTHARPSEIHANQSEAFTRSTSKSQDDARGSHRYPFIIEDDSNEEPPLPLPPSSRLQPQASSSKAHPRLSTVEEEAARQASRRLRLEAQGLRQFTNTSKARDTIKVHSGDDTKAKSAHNEARDLQNATSQQPEALTRINAFESSRSGSSNLSNSTSVRQYNERSNHDVLATSEERDGAKTYTPRTARDPADVRRDLTKRLGNQHSNDPSSNSGTNKQISNAWAEAESARRRAVREADAKRDAAWHEEQERQRIEELRKFKDRKQAVASHRQTSTREYASHQSNMDFRQFALERLQAANTARKPTRPMKAEPEAPGNESNEVLGSQHDTQCQVSKTVAPSAGIALPAAGVLSRNAIEKSREARIEEKQARNARLREAELQGEDENVVGPAAPSLEEPSEAPRSLHSIEGRQLLSRSDDSTMFPGSVLKRPRIQAKHSSRNLLPILPQDVKLMVWWERDKRDWQDMVDSFRQFYGLKRTDETLRMRYRQIKKAIEQLGPSPKFYKSLLDGDSAMLEMLNDKISEVLQNAFVAEPSKVTGTVSSVPMDRSAHDQIVTPPGRRAGRESSHYARRHVEPELVAQGEEPESMRTIPTPLQGVEQRDPTTVPAAASAQLERRQHAGKTWSPEAWEYYMECLYDEFERENEPVPDRLTLEDEWHYAYQVQRRQITTIQIEQADETLEDMQWVTQGDFYDTLTEANLSAIAAVTHTPDGNEHVAVENYTMERSTSDEGMAAYLIDGEHGTVQTRVTRFIRRYDEGKRPTHMDSLISRTLYAVMERTVKTTPGDGLFENGQTVITEKPLSNEIFSSAEMANKRAVKRCIALGHRSNSVNLDERDQEARELEQELLSQIDDEEGQLFSKTLCSDDDRSEITIWVEEQRLMGPRNIK